MLEPLKLLIVTCSTVIAAPPHRDTTPRDTLVLAHEFTAPHEFARTTLEAGRVYRVEVMDANQLQVRTLRSGRQLPIIERSESFSRASHTLVFELHPSVTTTYEFRVGGLRTGAAPIRVWWDADGTKREKKLNQG